MHISTHPGRLEANSFTSLTDGQLYRPPDDSTLGCTPRLAFADKESTIRSKPIAALMAIEAAIVPLAADGSDDHIIQDMLLTAQATGCRAAGMTFETPCEAVFFNEGGLRVEGLYSKARISKGYQQKKIVEDTYITAFRTEEVTDVPFRATGNYHFALDRGLAALAAGTEELVEVQVTVETGHAGNFIRCIC